MKKTILLLIACALLLGMAASAEINPLLGQTMPDFSFEDTEGRTIALADLLAEKDLVVVNIFTSWCPPCRMEFPEMESVYQALSDRMEIVAVSDEPTDTLEIIADYKAELGLSFPMGSAKGTGIVSFANLEGYPTTLFVDKGGKVVYYNLGSFASEAQFRSAAEYVLDEAYDGSPLVGYNVYVCDQNQDPVPGVTLTFCTDTACAVHVSDENGCVNFAGPPETYHLQVIQAPDGYAFEADPDLTCDDSGDWVILQGTKE